MDPITVYGVLSLIGFTAMLGANLPPSDSANTYPDTTEYYRKQLGSIGEVPEDFDFQNPEHRAQLRQALEQLATNSPPCLDPNYSYTWDPDHPWFNMPLSQWARLRDTQESVAQQREDSSTYTELGPLYTAPTPVAGSIGRELGIVTRDTQAGTVQRTGVGFYLRSDHLLNHRYAGTAPRA